MNRRLFAAMLGAALLVSVSPPAALEHGSRVTIVVSQRVEPYQQTLAGLRHALDAMQPRPRVEVVHLEGASELAPAALVSRDGGRTDLFVAIGARAARALRAHELHAPVLVATVADSLLHRADRGMAGVGMEFPYALQFQTLRAAAPRVRTVGTIYEAANRGLIDQADAAAREAGLRLVRREIRSVTEVPDALAGLIGTVDALWAIPDATVFTEETSSYIILQTLRHRVPFMGFSQSFVKAGSLLSLYPDFEDIGLQAGAMARDVLAGRRAAGGGIVAPRKAMLAVNLRVADVIGLSIPATLRKRADAVYE